MYFIQDEEKQWVELGFLKTVGIAVDSAEGFPPLELHFVVLRFDTIAHKKREK